MESELNFEFADFQYNPEAFDSFQTEETKQELFETPQNQKQFSQDTSNQNDSRDLVSKIKQPNWNCIYINPYLNEYNQTFSLFNGFTITSDGAIRFNYNLDQISFGYWQQRVLQVAELHKLGVLDISYSNDKIYKKNKFQDALNFLKYVPNIDFQKVYQILTQTEQIMYDIKSYLQTVVTEEMKDAKEVEYQLYLQHCFNYLQYFCQNNPNQMFYYTILRLNLCEGDPEIARTGYSKSYLQLLGIESSALSQILMRNKRLDLIREKADISFLGLQGVCNMTKGLIEEYYEQQINTFDGFPIKLKFTKKSISHGFDGDAIPNMQCLYGFIIVEIDIDLYELQQLIHYRQRLMHKQQNYEDYLKKELSLLYEDVEYSVQTQIFLEKYYVQNIEQLKDLKNQKIKNKYKYYYKMINQ